MSGRNEDRLRNLARLPVIEPPAELEARVLAAMSAASPGLAMLHESAASKAKAASNAKAALHAKATSHAAPVANAAVAANAAVGSGPGAPAKVALAFGWPAAWQWTAHPRAAAWLVPLGVGVLLAALLIGPDSADPAREPIAASAHRPPLPEAADREPAAEAFGQVPVAESLYRDLVEQAVYLEFVLASMPRRQVMRVSTAGTIIGLEERIALIDAELDRVRETAPEYRTALMLDRVDTMNALVNLRYAQSRAISF